MISRLSSKTDMPVPSKVIRCGSFQDLNLKKTDDDMMNAAKVKYTVNGLSLEIKVLKAVLLWTGLRVREKFFSRSAEI